MEFFSTAKSGRDLHEMIGLVSVKGPVDNHTFADGSLEYEPTIAPWSITPCTLDVLTSLLHVTIFLATVVNREQKSVENSRV
jgi:hypothetical protein